MASAERPGPPTGPLRPWPVLRSLLIGLVVLVHGTIALPWPDLKPRDLQYGVAQDELKRGVTLLEQVGIHTTKDELADDLLAVGRGSKRVQKVLHGPFRPILRATGTGQSWGLFAYPDPYAGRLIVRTQDADGAWTERYRAPGQGDPDMVALLQYRRVRGIYDDNGDRPKAGFFYDRMCDWLGARILAAEPDVQQVEIRFDLVTIRKPGDRRPAVPEEPRHVRTISRSDVAWRLRLLGQDVPDAPTVAPPVGP